MSDLSIQPQAATIIRPFPVILWCLSAVPGVNVSLPSWALAALLVSRLFLALGLRGSPCPAPVAASADAGAALPQTPSTWSFSQWGSHHSSGSTNSPWRLTAKWRWSPAGQARGAGAAQDRAFLHLIPHLDVNLAHVAVAGKDPQAVVQDHRIAVNPQGLGADHHAVVRRRTPGCSSARPGPLPGGSADPRPCSGTCRCAGPRSGPWACRNNRWKGPGPQGLGVALGRRFSEIVRDSAPQLPVDLQIGPQEVAGIGSPAGWWPPFAEIIREIEAVVPPLPRLGLQGHRLLHFVAQATAGPPVPPRRPPALPGAPGTAPRIPPWSPWGWENPDRTGSPTRTPDSLTSLLRR